MDTSIIKEMLGRCQGISSSIEKTLKDIKILFFTSDKGMSRVDGGITQHHVDIKEH
jgi:hypothetical protein